MCTFISLLEYVIICELEQTVQVYKYVRTYVSMYS